MRLQYEGRPAMKSLMEYISFNYAITLTGGAVIFFIAKHEGDGVVDLCFLHFLL